MAGGTALAQLLTVVFTPIITRLFPPDAYGVLGTFASVVTVITPLVGLSYPMAIVMARDEKEVKVLCFLSFVFTFLLAILVLLGVFQYEIQFQSYLGLDDVPLLPYLLPASIVFIGAAQVLRNLLIREKAFRSLAKVEVFNSIVNNLLRVVLGLFYPFAPALIGLYVFGFFVQGALYKVVSGYSFAQQNFRGPLLGGETFRCAVEYRDFALYRGPQGAINAVSQSLPVFALGMAFDQQAVGFYVLAKNILTAPLSLVGKSVSDVLYPRFSELVSTQGDVRSFILRVTSVLFLLAVPAFLAVVIFGREIFGFVFGAHWSQSGVYASWLSVWLLFGFINRPAVSAMAPLGLQKFFLKYELLSVALRLMALVLGVFVFANDVYTIAFFSIVGAVANLYLIFYVINHSEVRPRKKPI